MGTGTVRLDGVDVTRGLAVLGMATAHVGPIGERWSEPAGWLQVADGRSAATFAVLAGVSIGLLSGGTAPTDLRRARGRVLARAALIGLIGVVLAGLGTPVAVILPTYALMFVALVPVLGVPARTVLAVAVAWFVAGQLVLGLVDRPAWEPLDPVSMLVGPLYPAVVWTAYLLAGLAVTRSGLLHRPGRLAAVGAALAVVGYGTGAVGASLGPTEGTWLNLRAHSSTPVEMLGNLGVALLVLAAALALAPRARGLLAPLAATGALALTAYTCQLVAIAVLGDDVVWRPTVAGWLAFLVVTVLGCWAWRARLGRGPLERVVHATSVLVADAVVEPLPDRV